MKIALINDTHFGIKNGDPIYRNHQKKFFDEIFFPYLIDHNIKYVIHLGDLLDNRKSIDIDTLTFLNDFFNKFHTNNISLDIIIGNHDCKYKSSNYPNFPSELASERVFVYSNPVKHKCNITGFEALYIPWINDSNVDEVLRVLEDNRKSNLPVFGHFEFMGFEMNSEVEMKEGISSKIVDDYPIVLSGHYHKKSQKNNVHYLGTQYQLTWADYNDVKGFHIYDTEDMSLDFVTNPYQLFDIINYDDIKSSKNLKDLKDKIVNILVEDNDTDINKKIIEKVQNVAHKATMTINQKSSSLSENSIDIDDLEDTVKIIEECISQSEYDNKNDLIKYVKNLYNESLNME